jgi:hypothetical protein
MAEEKDRRHLIMRIGVVSIMVLIMFFWVLNIKNVFNAQREEDVQNKEEWTDIKNDLNNTLDKMNQGLDKINNANIVVVTTSSPEISSSTISTSTPATSSPIFSSSSSSLPVVPTVPPVTKKTNSNCPSYINCMPTVGEARACQIPVGCEGITQIAY